MTTYGNYRELKFPVGMLYTNKFLGFLSADAVGTKTSLSIATYAGPTLPSGTKLTFTNRGGYTAVLALSAELTAGDTTGTITSSDILETLPTGTGFYLTDKQMINTASKQFDNVHIHLYHTGGNNAYDYLTNFSQWNFNVSTGTILVDGVVKPNRWGSQYGVFTATDVDCTIESVKGYFSTNAGTADDFAFSLWTKGVTADGTTDLAMDLVESWTCRSQNHQDYVFELALTTPTPIPAGSVLIPSIRRVNSYTSSSKIYADIELIISS